MSADRYLRTGAPVPAIYHGTMEALMGAIRDTQLVSARLDGQHFLEAVYGGSRKVLRIYEDGELTYLRGDEEDITG